MTLAGIVELEAAVDRLLRDQTPSEQFVQALRAALQAWSRAIWAAAEEAGPSTIPANEQSHGLALAQRPVFICGPARSGTTLLRDLLDSHPQLVVIPTESSFYTRMERALMTVGSNRHCSYLGRWWVERLADPPPFWLFGPSGPDGSPYVDFARDFAGWSRVPTRIASWPLAALALAVAQRLGDGRVPPTARRWVEKTPGNERCLARIWQDFPHARVIQIVRQPEAVLASIKRMPGRPWSRRRSLAHVVGKMAPSYRIAADGAQRFPEDRFLLVRYEDLAADSDKTMRRIAGFLEIDALPSLLRPTIAGRTAFNNTSFASSRPDLREILDPVDRALLAAAVARPAARLGYARA